MTSQPPTAPRAVDALDRAAAGATQAYRLGAPVRAVDGFLGQLVGLVADPVAKEVTHLVITGPDGTDRLVERTEVVRSSPDGIELCLSRRAFASCEPFRQPRYLRGPSRRPADDPGAQDLALWLFPFIVPLEGWSFAVDQRVPPHEIAVRRGATVVGPDGQRFGQVDEFLLDPADGQITHLVLRSGHRWGRRTVTVPLADIRRGDAERVELLVGPEVVGNRPDVPVTSPPGRSSG